MTSTNMTATQRALAREWLAARIVVIGGFVIALLAALYFGVIVPKVLLPRELHNALVNQVVAVRKAELQICTMTLNSARNYGIVPQYGQLTSNRLDPTDVRGRYVCLAATKAAKYIMAVDLLCRDVASPRCTSLYSVSQADGTVLYQRQR
jgi:hypothetical protein